jgi:hypothetical protein
METNMHQLIALSVGHLKAVYEDEFDADTNYPVYIDEPLIVLSLLSIFEKQPQTQIRNWITDAFATARNRSSLGFMFEETVALVLLEKFGGKFTALGDVFHVTDPSLASRKVTLVALRRTFDGVMQCSRLVKGAYTSNRLCFKASNPEEVLSFLRNPNGIVFLFPDNNMGPDVIAFAEDQETGELIVLACQCKLQELHAQLWMAAVRSITPEMFYTVVVHFEHRENFMIADIY